MECAVLCSEDNIRDEISEVISHIPRINAHYYKDFNKLKNYLYTNSTLFTIVATRQNDDSSQLTKLYTQFPHIYFIYYYPSLNIDSFQYTNYTNFNYIVIGEKRITLLSEIILNLTKSYWKKIPYEKFNIIYEDLSPRMRRIMNYIETHDLKHCGTAEIANYLNISQGYFSQEFKKETLYTFRDFMQKLLDHYELLIFERLKLSAKATAKILGYSELSSFSRSFKKRKGYPPSHQKDQHLIEVQR